MHVQVSCGATACVAGNTQQLTLYHLLSQTHIDIRQMGVGELKAVSPGTGSDAHLVAVGLAVWNVETTSRFS